MYVVPRRARQSSTALKIDFRDRPKFCQYFDYFQQSDCFFLIGSVYLLD